jgi:WD40 repeat protein
MSMSTITESATARDSPYFGLDYYREQYGAWFFGRETEGSKIITNLRAARLTLLHAGSGVGKSSLLRAGVAWRMRKIADDNLARRGTARSLPIVFSSWKDDPVAELAVTIRAAIAPYVTGPPAPALPGDGLDAVIAGASEATNASLLIMLDQFEEYFLYRSREPTPERFADELARCINQPDLRANFLIAIREDAYAGLGDLFKGRIANVYSNYLHIDYLDRASAEQAIRGPLDVYNAQPGISEPVTIQGELVEAVLNQVSAIHGADGLREPVVTANGDGHVATPLLQLVMETVWEKEREEGSHELRLSTLENLRGVRMILDDHLGKALSALGRDERQTAIDMFDHLVTPSGGKIAESIPDLAQRTGHSEDEVGKVLEQLDHERIVRSIPAPPGQDAMRFRRYEIFHDVLAPTINRAIAAREERRRVRRIRRFAALAVGLLVAVSVVAVAFAALLNSANTAKNAANHETLTAESRELAAEADLNVANDPQLSALLALKALHLQDTSQAEEAMRAALPGLQGLRTFNDGSTVFSAEFDPADTDQVVSSDFSGVTRISDVKTGQRLREMSLGGMTVTGSADSAAFNPSGTEVAVAYGGGTVAVFDARTGKKLVSASDGSGVIYALAFLGNTGEIAIASGQNLALWPYQKGSACCRDLSSTAAYTIATDPADPQEFAVTTASGPAVWNVSGPGPYQPRSLVIPSTVNDAGFSPNGSEIVTADGDGTADIYDLAAGRVVTTLSAGEPDALSAAFSPDGQQVAIGYLSGTVRVWNVSTALPLTLLIGNAGSVNMVQFSADGSEVLSADDDGTVRVWDALPRELRTEFTDPPSGGTPSLIGGIAYISNRIVALDRYDHVGVFTAGGQEQAAISDLEATWVTWDHAGTEMAISSGGTVGIWRASGSNYAQISVPSPIDVKDPGSISLSADGSRIAVAVINTFTAQVRNADTGALLRKLNTDNFIQAIVISPNGREVVAGDNYGYVEVWNNGATNPRLLGTSGPIIKDVQFNWDGTEYVSASAGGIVNVWAASNGRLLTSIDACLSAYTASFSRDGSKIVVACGDGTVRVFDTATGAELAVLQATSVGVVSGAAFSPDGRSIVAGIDTGTTGYIQVWNTELATSSVATLEQLAEQRVNEKLTAAQQKEYLAGISG